MSRIIAIAATLGYLLCSLVVFAELTERDVSLSSLEEIKTRNNAAIKRKVKFQKVFGNFLIFYDYAGDTLVLEFKRDKWDYSLDKKVAFLRRGTTYFVDFEYWGAAKRMPPKNMIKMKSKIALLNRNDRNVVGLKSRGTRNVQLGKFKNFTNAVVDKLRY